MIHGQRVLGLIPARGGSKGIPGKNLVPLGGRPLIAWTIEAGLASSYIDRLVLSTDDDDISAVGRNYCCDVPFRRDSVLAADASATIDVILDVLDRLEGYQWIVLLQPTSPLRTADDIDRCIGAMLDAEAPAAVSVCAAENHPYLVFRTDHAGRMSHYVPAPIGASLRRQDLPQAWCLNGAVYVARVDWLRTNCGFITDETIASPMPAERSIDIDTPDDLARARSLVQAASCAVSHHS